MDTAGVVSLAVPLLSLGAVLLGVAQAIATGALPRNGLVGLRTSATRASDRAWAAGHSAARSALTATGVVLLASGLGAVLLALLSVSAGDVVVVAGWLVLAVGMLVAVRSANAAARAADR